MRKLLTMMTAVAVGVGLHAAGMADTGTSFEGLEAGDYNINAITGELLAQEAGQTYWVTNGTDQTLTVTNGTSVTAEYEYPGTPSRPQQYIDNGSSQAKYLSIKTTLGNPVTRNVSVGGAGTSIGDGFYFDSLVKFTAFDSDPAINLDGGKLAIWLKESVDEDDKPTATNLVITAGYLSDNGVVVTNYPCNVAGVNLNDGGWHRVTVKAISNIYKVGPVPGFVVYVDGVYATSTAEKGIDTSALTDNAYAFNTDGAIFPSADQDSGAINTISSVSFDGQGDVDDLIFTATAPDFAKDKEFFTIELGANVASLTYSVYGMGLSETITETTRIQYVPNMGVTVTGVTYDPGYMAAGITTSASVTLQDNYYFPGAAEQSITVSAKLAGAAINGTPYETAAAAFAAITAGTAGAGPFTVTLTTAAESGVELDSASAEVVLDLAGNNITAGENDAAAITLMDGTLLVTNSTVTVGEVTGYNGGSALVTAGGTLTIAGGIYNGAVDVSSATSLITGGSFSVNDNKDPDSETLPPAPNGDLAKAVMTGYALEVVSQSTYYTLVEKTAATVNVTVTGGDNATAVWTVNGSTVSAPATLTEGDVYEVVYTADTGYAFGFGATTSASGTAGTEDISITISNATAINYAITYNLNTAVAAAATNAEGAVASYTIATPTFAILDAGCVGFNFLGWLDANDNPVTQVAQGSTGNISLTAQWEVITNTVTFKKETEDVAAYATALAPYGQPVITVPENPTKTDYTFEGWSTDGTVANVVNLDEYLVVADVTLYAVWSQVQTDPIPAIDAGATAEQVAAAIAQAGFTDSGVATLINGDAATYLAFKAWADTVTGGGSSESTVVNSSHAAISYKLKDVVASPTLFTSAPEVSVTAVTPGTNCAVTFELKNGESTVTMSDAVSAYVGKILKGTSPTSLTACTTDDVAGVAVDENGKATVTLTKPSATAGFFKFDVE